MFAPPTNINREDWGDITKVFCQRNVIYRRLHARNHLPLFDQNTTKWKIHNIVHWYIRGQSKPQSIKIINETETRIFRALLDYMDREEVKAMLRDTTDEFVDMCTLGVRTVSATDDAQLIELFVHFDHIHAADPLQRCHVIGVVSIDYCSKLVARKQIEGKDGYGVFYCKDWRALLETMFMLCVTKTTRRMIIEHKFNEFRVECRRISATLDKILAGPVCSHPIANMPLNAMKIRFPLCIRHLMIELDVHHRLSNNDRFVLITFFREVGVTIDEQRNFWQTHYSVKSEKNDDTWADKQKNIEYTLNHKYGLVGKKQLYYAPNCAEIIRKRPAKHNECVCPFATFDADKLSGRIKQSGTIDIEDIGKIVAAKDHPQFACTQHMFAKAKALHVAADRDALVMNPVEFVRVLTGPKISVANDRVGRGVG